MTWTQGLRCGRIVKTGGVAMALGPKQQTFEVALYSAFSCLVTEAARKGSIDFQDLITAIEASAATHRENGNTILADYIHGIAQRLVPPAGPDLLGPRQP